MQGSQKLKAHVDLKCESVWFKTKLISQFLTLSFLLTQPFYLSYLHAAPTGGEVVGGTGSISQTDLITTINQTSQNLAVDWQSFDVNTNERVQFIQPDSTSIALNRILGNNGSTIQGQIDANGQVILINPNGIYFTSTATINVGGLVASSLDMTPADFMNGNYIFNEVLGADGAIINSGIINASLGGDSSTGGNVALIGKQVKNEGLITANLGSVVLAAGKQSILTFDNQGLIGVTVTKEVLQSEVGLEEAVINSGSINATGGRVLLTASTSQDVFSQAVNNGSLGQATSVVVNSDGSFTLGDGADVLNTGSIDVSSATNDKNTARIVLLGENVTSSGTIKADVENGKAGEIEVHAKDKALLTENSITSAQALSSGQGGLIKVLGDKVGLFDAAQINASGANGGGEVLIGGDRQGLNASIRNANFIYLGENTTVKADATGSGNGGKIITFAQDTARIHGNLFARGGLNGGDGGFIETSGLRGFEITNAPDVSAVNGNGGLWLIDPYNIRIINGTGAEPSLPGPPIPGIDFSQSAGDDFFSAATTDATLDVRLIQLALGNGDVEVNTGSTGDGGTQVGNISFEADLDFNSAGNQNRTLSLKASNDITFTNASSITDTDRSGGSRPDLTLELDAGGDISLSSDSTGINLFNGNLNVLQASAVTFNGAIINTDGGKVDIQSSSSVALNGGAVSTNGGDFIISTTGNISSANPATNSITTSNGNFIVDDAIDFNSSSVSINVGSGDINLDGTVTATDTGVTGDVVLGDLTTSGFTTSDLFITRATSISQARGSTITIKHNTFLDVASGSGTITLEENTNDFNNIKFQGANVSIADANSIYITGGSAVTSLLKIKAAGIIEDNGSFTVSNTSNTAIAIFDAAKTTQPYGNVILDNNNNFNNVKIVNANNVEIKDVTSGIALEANDGAGSGGIRGTLTVDSTGAGNITDMDGVTVSGTTYTGEINVGGTSEFTVATGQSIYLDVVNNTLGGNVTFLGYDSGSPEIKDISIVDDDTTGLSLSNIAVTGDLKVTAGAIVFGNDTHANNLEATTNVTGATGNITQTGHLVIANSTTLDATGNITLNRTNNNFNALTILNGNNVTVYDDNTLTLMGSNTSGNLTIDTDNLLTISGDIATNSLINSDAGNVLFQGSTSNVEIASNVEINTKHVKDDGLVYADGSVTFTDAVDNATASPRYNLDVISGTGNVTFEDVGQSQALNKFTVLSSTTNVGTTVSLKKVTTTGASAVDNIDVTGNIIKLDGNLLTNSSTSNAGNIVLTGNVSLVNNLTINTNGGTTDGAVTISGTVNSATTAKKLTITSDSGEVDLQQANVGGTNALSALEINSGSGNGTVSLGTVTTNGGNNVVRVDGTTITLNGNINSNNGGASGDVHFDGDLIINNAVTIDSAGSGNGDVTVNGNITGNDAVTTDTLTIKAASSTVNLNGDIGGDAREAIQGLDITSDTARIRNVNTGSDGVNINTSTLTLNDIDGSSSIDTTDNPNDAGDVLLTQNTLDLQADVSINTNSATGTDGAITINNSTDANNRSISLDAGNASVSINTALSNLSAFTVVNSHNSTLNGIETNDGQITVNAYNNILLAGSYNSGTEDTAFNADISSTDSNTGGLTLGTGSSFSGQNIRFSGYSLSANPDSVSVVDTIEFNSTESILNIIGSPSASPSFELTTAFLSSISGVNSPKPSTIQLSSSGNSVVFNNANLSTISSTVNVNAPDIYFSTTASQFNNINTTATNTIHVNKDINASGDITLNAPTINSDDSVVNINGSTNITSTSGTINIINGANTVNITGPDDFNLNANTITHGDILIERNINITSGGTYAQTGDIESTNGNISITATTGNIGLAYNKTNTGTITVNASNGSIYDNNSGPLPDPVNIETAGTINLTAANGIGDGNPLEIVSVGPNMRFNAINTSSGDIEIANQGTIYLDSVVNTGRQLFITNTGGDVLGAYDGNQQTNPRTAPHVTADIAYFDMTGSGSVGQFGSPLITNVTTRIQVANETRVLYIDFYGTSYPHLIGQNAYNNLALQAIENIAGQQLIEVESLGEIDAAIFTDVKNYSHSEIALMMPSDQRYTEDEEEDEDEKSKRQKYMNTIH